MFSRKIAEQPATLIDQAVLAADHGIESAQRATSDAIDSLNGVVNDVRHQALPMIDRAATQATELAHRGADAVRGGARQVRDQAQRASDGTVHYIKDEPIKSILMAAATGAALMALISLASRWSQRD